MIQQRHSNIIMYLHDSQDIKLILHHDIQQLLVSFYDNLLTKPIPHHCVDVCKITQNIPNVVNPKQNLEHFTINPIVAL